MSMAETEKRELFVETITETSPLPYGLDINGRIPLCISGSNVRPASQEDISRFFKRPCNHLIVKGNENLVYYKSDWMYTEVNCAVCDRSLGVS